MDGVVLVVSQEQNSTTSTYLKTKNGWTTMKKQNNPFPLMKSNINLSKLNKKNTRSFSFQFYAVLCQNRMDASVRFEFVQKREKI